MLHALDFEGFADPECHEVIDDGVDAPRRFLV
jgi:hypothetical protein